MDARCTCDDTPGVDRLPVQWESEWEAASVILGGGADSVLGSTPHRSEGIGTLFATTTRDRLLFWRRGVTGRIVSPFAPLPTNTGRPPHVPLRGI